MRRDVAHNANGEGTVNLALEIPTNTLFTGSFYIQLPEGFTVNTEKTSLAEALAGVLDWSITQEEGNKWLITISLKAETTLRRTADVAYTQIMQIIYNVEESVEDGTHEWLISELNFEFEDGTVIEETAIPVAILVDHSYVGIKAVTSEVQVYILNNQLYVNTPQKEMIYLYTIAGQLEYSGLKQEGTE